MNAVNRSNIGTVKWELAPAEKTVMGSVTVEAVQENKNHLIRKEEGPPLFFPLWSLFLQSVLSSPGTISRIPCASPFSYRRDLKKKKKKNEVNCICAEKAQRGSHGMNNGRLTQPILCKL